MTNRTAALIEEIRAKAARKRITQATIATHLQISTSAMSRRMLGESDFTIDELYSLADLFGIPLIELLGPAALAEAGAS